MKYICVQIPTKGTFKNKDWHKHIRSFALVSLCLNLSTKVSNPSNEVVN